MFFNTLTLGYLTIYPNLGIIFTMRIKKCIWTVLLSLCITIMAGGSVLIANDPVENIRFYTRAIEFDYVSWTLEAIKIKLEMTALGTYHYIDQDEAREHVLTYMNLLIRLQQVEAQIQDILADPNTSNPDESTFDLHQERDKLQKQRLFLEPLAEAILQQQISQVVHEFGLSLLDQPIPPVSYHMTPPPYGLIISPRHVVRQDADISISPELKIEEQIALEKRIQEGEDVSALIVGIGGVGLYPTMVMQTTDLYWLCETVAHEWIHNYLTLRPLGISYYNSPELRIMNETTASIAGKEIGYAVIERFYPELLPEPVLETRSTDSQGTTLEPPAFDYQAEMRLTRVNADRLLAEEKIEQAETYMELRRRFFWDNGYHIRKINQAFFAFYGAYADQEGGAAGEDPVGAGIRTLRAQSSTLADFINRVSWLWSFSQLEKAISTGQ